MMAVYVDDTAVASNDLAMLAAKKINLKEWFEMEGLGEIHSCLGMSIKRDRNAKSIMISQKAYPQNVLKRFRMQDCNPVSTPMESTARYEKLSDDENRVNTREYRAIIGSLTQVLR